MHILITNDDGVHAPGLFALTTALRKVVDKVTVFAPNRNWSAAGHNKTMHKPLRITETTLEDGSTAWTTDGAPSDCVALAKLGFINEKIDMVVSGINPNANIGHDVTYSGTVTAAMEAAIWKVPGLAVSVDNRFEPAEKVDFSTSAKAAQKIVFWLKNQADLPNNMILNINVPYLPLEEIKGYEITRQGLRIYRDELVRRIDPRGQPYYWIGGEVPTAVNEPGTDFGALSKGFVSITPIQLDLTSHKLQTWMETHRFDVDLNEN